LGACCWRRSGAGSGKLFAVDRRLSHADLSAAAVRSEPAPSIVTESATPGTPPENNATPSGDSFRELRRCVYASRELVAAKRIADCSFYEGKPQYQVALADCLNGATDAQNRISAAEKTLAQCDQTDLGMRYFKATKEAAKRGDVDAQLCYLHGDFFSPEGASIFPEAELEEYKTVAPSYVDAALKRGDWRIVHLLYTRHFHPGGGPIRLMEGVGERETQYKMTKLLRLGASGFYAIFLESRLEGMKHRDLNPAAALPAHVMKEGDAWAEQTYLNYFAGVPSLTEVPVVCGSELGR
jgi:hypothetical protein